MEAYTPFIKANREMHGKLELNRLQQMKTSHFVIDCHAPPNSRHKSSERRCTRVLQNSLTNGLIKGGEKNHLREETGERKGREGLRCGEFLLQRRQFLRKTNSEKVLCSTQWLHFFCSVAWTASSVWREKIKHPSQSQRCAIACQPSSLHPWISHQ